MCEIRFVNRHIDALTKWPPFLQKFLKTFCWKKKCVFIQIQVQ